MQKWKTKKTYRLICLNCGVEVPYGDCHMVATWDGMKKCGDLKVEMIDERRID